MEPEAPVDWIKNRPFKPDDSCENPPAAVLNAAINTAPALLTTCVTAAAEAPAFVFVFWT